MFKVFARKTFACKVFVRKAFVRKVFVCKTFVRKMFVRKMFAHTRMFYASYHMKRRDSLIPVMKNNLMEIRNEEEILLRSFVKKSGVL